MATIDLSTSLDDYHDMHLLADGRKASVKVDRQKLLGLLLDHSTMIGELKRHGVICRDPEVAATVHRQRERIE